MWSPTVKQETTPSLTRTLSLGGDGGGVGMVVLCICDCTKYDEKIHSPLDQGTYQGLMLDGITRVTF